MKAFKIEVLVIDFENYGFGEIKDSLENNRHHSIRVLSSKEADIGEWNDDHPLNKNGQCDEELQRLFNSNCA